MNDFEFTALCKKISLDLAETLEASIHINITQKLRENKKCSSDLICNAIMCFFMNAMKILIMGNTFSKKQVIDFENKLITSIKSYIESMMDDAMDE